MIQNTDPLTGAKARKKILKGVNAVYDVVKRTLGPSGRNAILPRTFNRGPRNTNDGYTISENILLKDPHARLSAEFFKEGAKKTNELGGDGTTTTTVVAGYLVNEVFNKLPNEDIPSAGQSAVNVMTLRKEMKEAKDKVLKEITKRAKKIESLEELENIAFVSIEDKEIAQMVAKMVYKLGPDHHVNVFEGFKGIVETEYDEGVRFPAKCAHRAFVTHKDRHEMVAEDTHVLVTNHKIENPFEITAVLEKLRKPKLIIIAPQFSANVIASLAKTTQNGMFIYPVAVPSLRTEQMIDVTTYIGGKVIDKETGAKLDSVLESDLGYVKHLVVKDTENKEDAVITGGKGDPQAIKDRLEELKGQMKVAKNVIVKQQLGMRIANMADAVGVIRVGASTEAQGLYLKLKIEDGVYACKSALKEGYVQGGGLCLKDIAEKMPENILTNVLKEPYNQIQKNAGGSLKIGKDIIDPALVVKLEIEHGVEIASQMITTDILIPELDDETPAEGYKSIAEAVRWWAYFDAKHKGMLKDSELEQEKDMKQAFDEAEFLAND